MRFPDWFALQTNLGTSEYTSILRCIIHAFKPSHAVSPWLARDLTRRQSTGAGPQGLQQLSVDSPEVAEVAVHEGTEREGSVFQKLGIAEIIHEDKYKYLSTQRGTPVAAAALTEAVADRIAAAIWNRFKVL